MQGAAVQFGKIAVGAWLTVMGLAVSCSVDDTGYQFGTGGTGEPSSGGTGGSADSESGGKSTGGKSGDAPDGGGGEGALPTLGGADGAGATGGTDGNGATGGTSGEGATGGTGPAPTTCTGSEVRCGGADGKSIERCVDGQVQGDDVPCPFACVKGACVECQPKEQACQNGAATVCSDAGKWVSTACPAQCENGTCVGECKENNRQCDNLTPQLCTGGAYVKESACKYVCQGGACIGDCTPDTKRCKTGTTNVPEICDRSGSFIAGTTCSGSTPACLGGECVACTPDSVHCNSDGVTTETCSAAGKWVKKTTCSGETPKCSNGKCVGPCTPGAKQCSGSQPQVCDAQGVWKNEGSACSGCKSCSASTGECAAKTGSSCGSASCKVDSQGSAIFTPAGTCSSSGSCNAANGDSCSGSFTCGSSTACRSSCSSATDCVAGNYCASNKCVPKKSTGASCGGAVECANGTCIDGVCCSSTCTLASSASGSCLGCSNAATGKPNGTCAPRLSSAKTACPAANPTVCVDTSSDTSNCGQCGQTCSASGTNFKAACHHSQCGLDCKTAGQGICRDSVGAASCHPATNGFEEDEVTFNCVTSDATNDFPTTAKAHTGRTSEAVYTGDGFPAYMACFVCDGQGAFETRGKTLSAWIYIDADSSAFANARCFFYVEEVPVGVRTKPPAKSWFELKYALPDSTTRLSAIFLECDLPPEWNNDMTRMWYVDDITLR